MALSLLDWYNRFKQQARWTQDLRRYLYERAGLSAGQRLLDVGCGTGALLPELLAQTKGARSGSVHGLDIDWQRLSMAAGYVSQVHFLVGDAHYLPYAAGSFDLSLCHFLLLWVAGPQTVVAEMRRVTRAGGAVLILAEPDYGGRIDYPFELSKLGEWQQSALRRQGADPLIGRQLAEFMSTAGLHHVEVGVLGGQWDLHPSNTEQISESMVLRSDLADIVPGEDLDKLLTLDEDAHARGERILYVPTFYAWGRVPDLA